MRRLVILRPEPGATETVERAKQRGLDAVAIPVFTIESLPWEVPEASGFDALLLTSANAMRQGGEGLVQLRGLPVHAVGEATAKAARDAGFDIASSGDSGVDRLLASIEPELRLLHLCGEEAKAPVDAPQRITRIAVYRSTPIDAPDLTPIGGAVAIVHSPRGGARLAQLVEDRGSVAIAAISDAAAAEVGGGWKNVEIADRPSDEALLALAARLCNTSQP
jgi:uroporphyrinogen-III synthase